MKKQLCLLILCLPMLLMAQEQSAINWANGLSWQQVKEKAKKENKYIFVDCYATWCGPCKEMDKKVYTVDSVGDYLNSGFISVRVQMDSSKNDDANIKSWYKTASYLNKIYNLTAYPTLLFFTPAGEIASKEIGYRDAAAFISSARDSKDPSKQYYVLRKNYLKGKKDYNHMPFLFKTAVQLYDTDIYRPVRIDYYAYLHSLPKEKLFTKENIEFIAASINKSGYKIFDIFYPDGSNVNRVMKSDRYAQDVVDGIILKEKVNSFLESSKGQMEPDWNALYKSIVKDYNTYYAESNLLTAKMMWYSDHKKGMMVISLFNDKMEKFGSDTTNLTMDAYLNNQASIFAGAADSLQCTRIIKWMEGVARRGEKLPPDWGWNWPLYLDTYADLLFKVGRTNEAIKWQELAVTKSKERNIDENLQKVIEKNLEKMKKK